MVARLCEAKGEPMSSADQTTFYKRRTVRVPWGAGDDAEIMGSHGGDWVVTYPMLAARLNSKFHDGKPVRSPRAVERREHRLNGGEDG